MYRLVNSRVRRPCVPSSRSFLEARHLWSKFVSQYAMMRRKPNKMLDNQDFLPKNSAGTPDTYYHQEGKMNLLWAPTAHNSCEKSLLGVINIRTHTVYDMSIVTVWTTHKMLCSHPWLERLHNEGQQFMKELPAEFLENGIFIILSSSYNKVCRSVTIKSNRTWNKITYTWG